MAISSLKKFVVVQFDTPEHALSALESTQNEFMVHSSTDLSRADGGSVYLDPSAVRAGTTRATLKFFLLHQEGALPDGCYVK